MFDFLNEDASNAVSVDEFVNFGFLFNFREDAIKDIFKEFDLSGDQVCVTVLSGQCMLHVLHVGKRFFSN